MINYDNIPKEEFEIKKNLSLFNYQLGDRIFQDRKAVWQQFLNCNLEEAFQLLDNGTLIITQNIFGGQSIISKFTCGLYFCYELSKFFANLENIEQRYKATIGSDDFHSGWDYDFNLKIVSNGKSTVKLIKDYDFKIEVDFDRVSFIRNYLEFSIQIVELFEILYPDLAKNERFIELKGYNHFLNLLSLDK